MCITWYNCRAAHNPWDSVPSTPPNSHSGSPQGCVLSPLLYALYTYICSPAHPTNRIIKYADDTTVVGCICHGDETAYRAEVEVLSRWCSENNLTLNIHKTKELIMDFRKHIQDYTTPLLINGEQVETVTTFRFPGTHISANHSWTFNIRALVKKAQQWLHFLCVLRKDSLDTKLLLALYHSSVVSVHTLPECVVRGLHSWGQEGGAEGH